MVSRNIRLASSSVTSTAAPLPVNPRACAFAAGLGDPLRKDLGVDDRGVLRKEMTARLSVDGLAEREEMSSLGRAWDAHSYNSWQDRGWL